MLPAHDVRGDRRVVEARLSAAPGTDLRAALRGSRAQMTTLVRLANRTPSLWLDALPVLALPPATRARLHAALRAGAGAGAGLVYALLVAGPSMAGWAQTRNRDLALRPAEDAEEVRPLPVAAALLDHVAIGAFGIEQPGATGGIARLRRLGGQERAERPRQEDGPGGQNASHR
jgi:hypothetical protein